MIRVAATVILSSVLGVMCPDEAGTPGRAPDLVLVVSDAFEDPCLCIAGSNPTINSAVQLCAPQGQHGTCFKILNVSQPELDNGACPEVDGANCIDQVKDCSFSFECSVVYTQDCCGCGQGADLLVSWDNGAHGLQQDTISVGDTIDYEVAATQDCNGTDDSKKVGISAVCGGGGGGLGAKVEIQHSFTCAACAPR